MDEKSLYELDQFSILVVPTGTLTTHLGERYASQQIQQGKQAWEAPNITPWQELLRTYWQQNRHDFDSFHSLLNAQQASLLWTQVIDKSKLANSELTLLNVQQTVRACIRSHRLLSDWRCDKKALGLEHIIDVNQFFEWRASYLTALAERSVIDDAGLQDLILNHIQRSKPVFSAKRLIWYGYDLITAAQALFNSHIINTGVEVLYGGPQNKNEEREFCCFANDKQELASVFRAARDRLERKPDQTINIVIPDLQHRYSQVQEIARQTFYPNLSLTDVQKNNLVYRFSLGKPLPQWPAIEVALCALGLLKPRLAVSDLRFLFRSVYMAKVWHEKDVFHGFDTWLHDKRIRSFSLERLPALCEEYTTDLDLGEEDNAPVKFFNEFIQTIAHFKTQLNERLSEQKTATSYASLSFNEWGAVFTDWLDIWGWQTNSAGSQLSTVAHQLRGRWNNVVEEFVSLGTVQQTIGLASGINQFIQLVRDSVFLPKSAMSPVMISGLLEALGRETDVCYLTGMTQDFPTIGKNDAFIPNQYLLPTGYPDASAQGSVRQAIKVVDGLLASAEYAQISYAKTAMQRQDIANQASPLFTEEFRHSTMIVETAETTSGTLLEAFDDTQGPVWHSPEKAKGGSSIFKNQSLCAFKAFVTHQLRFKAEEEQEFGLDALDRGNLIHRMLELVWGQLSTQAALSALSEQQQTDLLLQTFDSLLEMNADLLPSDNLRLFALEKTRVVALCNEWLNLERKRPSNFSVTERERQYQGEWGGIRFDYIIDRVDKTESGQTVVIDYKTSLVDRKNWEGERPHEPQLPLYVLARDKLTDNKTQEAPLSGIAFAQLRRGDCRFTEMAKVGIFNPVNKNTERYEQMWLDNREHWPAILSRLAEEFLAGKADVNPVDDSACKYCKLAAVCRVQELKERSAGKGSESNLQGVTI